MNRRLIVLRHAKSSWGDPDLEDHDRPLNDRGRRDAPRVGRRLVELGWIPDRVVSSDAVRTRETWQLMAPEIPAQITAEWRPDFYLAGLDEIRDAAGSWPADTGTVLVLGHNPGWEEAVAALAGIDEPMTTANAALLEGAGADWPSAFRGRWELVEMVRPRRLSS